MNERDQHIAEIVLEHADRIYVRDEMDGKWGSYALTELPVSKALAHAFRFILEGRVPVVVKDV